MKNAVVKCAVALSFLLAGCGILLGDTPNPGRSSVQSATLLDDLVRMTTAGSSDAAVLAYAKAHRSELPAELSEESLRWLRNSGVSERVVRYMTAIDVRSSDEGGQQGVSYGAYDDSTRPRAADSSEGDYAREGGGYPDVSVDSYAGGYPDSDYDAYSGYGYGDYYPPYFGYGYYPYSSYFFVDRFGSFRRFHGRDHRFRGHRGFDGGRGFRGPRGGVDRGGSRDSWRDRGFRGRRGGPIVVAPRGSERSTFARRGFSVGPRAPRGNVIGHRGFAPGPGRASLPRGFGGPRMGVGGHGGFSHPAPSSGFHTGGGFRQSPTGISRGGRATAGLPGGRGRR
jgi:hypothetical protein